VQDSVRSAERPAVARPGGLSLEGRDLALAVLAAIVYFLAAKFGLLLIVQPGGVALFWPAAGLAVGARLALGPWSERPLAAGIAAATFIANITGDRSAPLALVFAAVNVLEFVIAARVAERYGGQPFRLNTLRAVFAFFLATVLGAAAASLTASLAIVALSPYPNTPLASFEVWFRSDAIGIIGIAPFIISLHKQPGARNWLRVHIEGILILGLLAAGSFVFFSLPATPDRFWTHISPVVALFPLLLLIAARLPLVYASAAVAIIALTVEIASTVEGGRFSDPSLPMTLNVMYAQLVIVSAAICSLTLAALVAERRASEDHQRLLISQLDHRVKNSLTLMQAVVERSQECANSIADFGSSLGGRIRSMARTHSKLSEGKWQGLCLEALVRDELAPYQTAGADDVSGPSIKLKPQAAQSISMVIHELATNAAKYGALSTPHGRVSVRWTIDRDAADEEVLDLVWKESGGPPVTVPEREGFGTSTIRGLLPYEIGGRVELLFDPRGAVCRIRLPLLATVVGGEAGEEPKPAL
jgi:two-component sensor histidine kinase/integral membrane sensor domain MASE1